MNLDVFQMQQCEMQAALFESLGRRDIDAKAFIKAFRESGQEGVGFLTAFPHITKVFRYAPKMEILQHVRAFDTKTFAPISLIRDDFVEFACLAEALLAADEYKAWAAAGSVEEYLRYVSPVENAN